MEPGIPPEPMMQTPQSLLCRDIAVEVLQPPLEELPKKLSMEERSPPRTTLQRNFFFQLHTGTAALYQLPPSVITSLGQEP